MEQLFIYIQEQHSIIGLFAAITYAGKVHKKITFTANLASSTKIPPKNDASGQADLIPSIKFHTFRIPGLGFFLSVFLSMRTVPKRFTEGSVNLVEFNGM